MKKVTRCLVLFTLLLLLTSQIAHAESNREIARQSDENKLSTIGYVLAVKPTGIEFHGVSKSGDLRLAGVLPANIAIDRYGEAEWLIYSAFGLKVSPNGNNIAFTATNSKTNKIKLFIYQISQQNLIQKDLLEDMNLLWSPDSNSLLLSNRDQAQIYDVQTDHFTQVADFGFGEAIWLPDNQHIVYVGDGIVCDSPCKPFDDLHVINRDGKDNQVITNLGSQIPADAFHSICEPTWSARDKRVYYRVGCVSESRSFEYLYSTTLLGDNRLENAPDSTTVFVSRITNLETDILNSTIYGLTAENILGGASWKIMAFNFEPNSKVIFKSSRKSGDIPQHIALSPNGQHISLNASFGSTSKAGFLWIISVKSGDIVTSKEDLENICQLVWSDDKTIIFTQDVGGNPSCPDEIFWISPRTLSKFDLDTGDVTPLTSNFTVPTFFITVPES